MKSNINEKRAVLYFTIAIIIFILTLAILLFFNHFINSNKTILKDEKNNNLFNTNAITMMYETEANSGEYQIANDNTWPQEGYVFNTELSKCENGSKLIWNNENKKIILQTNISDRCYAYFDVEPPLSLVDYIMSQYTEDGVNGLYYHDGIGSYTNANQEAGDKSYRYAGANPNNYVCFGSDEETCPEDNLYRIIGVFDGQVKLIKSDIANSDLLGENIEGLDTTYSGVATDYSSDYYVGNKDLSMASLYSFNSISDSITWADSDLIIIHLNRIFIENFDLKWKKIIFDYNWVVSSLSYDISSIKYTYTSEILDNSNNKSNIKIGLMFVSDYGYASSPTNWNTDLNNYNNDENRNNNWMFMGIDELTMTGVEWHKFYDMNVMDITKDGAVNPGIVEGSYFVRPVFYLNSNIGLEGGSGTVSDPYRLAVG